MIKVKASITLDFDAPDGSDVWALVRNATTSAAMALTDCREKRPEIVKVTANGKPVTFKPRKR